MRWTARWRPASSRDALIAASGAQAARLWKMRESLAEAQTARPAAASPTMCPCRCRASRNSSRRADAALTAAYPGIRRCAFGHVGDGNMHYNPIKPLDWDWARFREERPRINRIVHDIVADLSGSISAEHGIGRSRLAELEHYKAACRARHDARRQARARPQRHHEPRQGGARMKMRAGPAGSTRRTLPAHITNDGGNLLLSMRSKATALSG